MYIFRMAVSIQRCEPLKKAECLLQLLEYAKGSYDEWLFVLVLQMEPFPSYFNTAVEKHTEPIWCACTALMLLLPCPHPHKL